MSVAVLHAEARAELDEAAGFFENLRSGNGVEFLLAYDGAIETLLSHPRAGKRVGRVLRRWILTDWRHSIYYAIEPYGIRVVAVSHHSRGPKYHRAILRR